MSHNSPSGESYDWDWRETPEWREVETALSNLVKLDPEAGDPMVTEFVIVAASVPGDLSAQGLVGTTTIFCSSRQPYVTKGLLVEGLDIQRAMDDDSDHC